MGATAGDLELDDRRATAWTGLALAAENVCEAEVAATFASGIDVISIGRASFLDAQTQHGCKRRVHPPEILIGQSVHGSRRMHLRAPECFVGVNIADTGDDCLVKQRRLDARVCPSLQPFFHDMPGKARLKRLRADFAHEIDVRHFGRRQQAHPAELTLVVKKQRAAIRKGQRNARRTVRQIPDKRTAGVPGAEPFAVAAEHQLPGHFQVNNKRVAAGQINDQYLGPAAHRGYRSANKERIDIARGVRKTLGIITDHVVHDTARQQPVQA